MPRREGGCLSAVAIALSLAVVAVGAALLYLVITNQPPTLELPSNKPLEPKAFDEYTWDELSEVAQLITEAPSEEGGRSVASEYGVEVGDVRAVPLSDGRQAIATVVGIRADDRADGTGNAGLTLMLSPIALEPMNSEATNAGGWEGSSLRAWLAGKGLELLPDELADAVVPVSKLTNNVGITSEVASVTRTSDALWAFSAAEVCGAPGWFVAEYGASPNPYTGYVDFTVYDELLAAEGEQYDFFASKGVSSLSDTSGALALDYGGAPTSWWYRTPYPYSFTGEDEIYFYQVMSTGYPSSVGVSSEPAGVAVGLCL